MKMVWRKKSKKVFKTGFEGNETAEVQAVNCPVADTMVSIDVCCGLAEEAKTCDYYAGHELMDRGKGATPKMIILCAAPRAVRVNHIIIKMGG
jgi:hypothetical protein